MATENPAPRPAKRRRDSNRRINRPTYWLLIVLAIAVIVALRALDVSAAYLEIAIIAVGVPRLHDIGRSGWFALGAIGLELLIILSAVFLGGSSDAILIAGGTAFLVMAALGTWLGSIPGQPHPNKWGPPPAPGINLTGRTASYDEVFE